MINLIYEKGANFFIANNEKMTSYFYELNCGNIVLFRINDCELIIEIPHFLLENIFCIEDDKLYRFESSINYERDLLKYDQSLHQSLNKNGYLPYSQTQFKNVTLLCSFLTYTYRKTNITTLLNFPFKVPEKAVTIEEIANKFKEKFNEKVKKRGMLEKYIIPLSGGMDSRLLASLMVKFGAKDIELFTVGVKNCGDILVSKKIRDILKISNDKHKIRNLEEFTYEEALLNYKKVGYLIPLDRLLGHNLNSFYEIGTIISGLYGDVIFADNNKIEEDLTEYLKNENIEFFSQLDKEIISEYKKLPKYIKLHRTLLRCQKLTRQTLCALNQEYKIIAPFIDPEIIMMSSKIKEKNIYSKIIKQIMDKSLINIIHQSSLSYFNHNRYIRKALRIFLKLIKHPYRVSYFNDEYLNSVKIKRNFSPRP